MVKGDDEEEAYGLATFVRISNLILTKLHVNTRRIVRVEGSGNGKGCRIISGG